MSRIRLKISNDIHEYLCLKYECMHLETDTNDTHTLNIDILNKLQC